MGHPDVGQLWVEGEVPQGADVAQAHRHQDTVDYSVTPLQHVLVHSEYFLLANCCVVTNKPLILACKHAKYSK